MLHELARLLDRSLAWTLDFAGFARWLPSDRSWPASQMADPRCLGGNGPVAACVVLAPPIAFARSLRRRLRRPIASSAAACPWAAHLGRESWLSNHLLYLHVYVCIYTYFNVYCLLYLTPGAHLSQDSIWTYMYVYLYMLVYVYVFVCIYACICTYEHVFPGMAPRNAGTDATPPKHSLSGLQPAGPTQGFLGHQIIHFFPPLATLLQTRFGTHTPSRTRPEPLTRPSSSTGKPPLPYLRSLIQSHGPSQEIWWVWLHPAAWDRLPPLESTSRQRFGGVSMCTYMHV